MKKIPGKAGRVPLLYFLWATKVGTWAKMPPFGGKIIIC